MRISKEEFIEEMQKKFDYVLYDDKIFSSLTNRLERYFRGYPVDLRERVDLRGSTEFQRKVLQEVMRIAYGEMRTYKEIAKAIGNEKAVRAVGQANARNPIPIIIPCHRVIGSDGSLVGFSSGIEIKRRLLELEGVKIIDI